MEILNIIKLAWTGLVTNKGRSFLTMLGIIIGVASVVIIISVGAGAQSLIYDQVQSLGSNLVGVLPGKGGDNGPPASVYGIVITTLKYEDVLAFVQGSNPIPHLVAVTAYSRGQGHMTYKNNVSDTFYNGVMAMYPKVIDQVIDEGRFFNEKEEKDLSKVVVLGSQLKEDLFGTEDPIGKNIKLNNESFQVIGTFAKKGTVAFQNLDDQAYLPVSTAQKILLGVHNINMIRGKVDEDQYVDQVMDDMRRTLRIRHHITNPDDDDFTVLSANKALSAISSVTNIIAAVLAAIAAISLLVGGIGIMNIMLVVVTERMREIGLRKAIGAHPSHIRNQFLVEALVVTCSGGIIGILLGMFVTTIVAFLIQALGYHWQLIFSFNAMFTGLCVAFGIGVIFGYYPALRASKLNAIDALRYE